MSFCAWNHSSTAEIAPQCLQNGVFLWISQGLGTDRSLMELNPMNMVDGEEFHSHTDQLSQLLVVLDEQGHYHAKAGLCFEASPSSPYYIIQISVFSATLNNTLQWLFSSFPCSQSLWCPHSPRNKTAWPCHLIVWPLLSLVGAMRVFSIT